MGESGKICLKSLKPLTKVPFYGTVLYVASENHNVPNKGDAHGWAYRIKHLLIRNSKRTEGKSRNANSVTKQ